MRLLPELLGLASLGGAVSVSLCSLSLANFFNLLKPEPAVRKAVKTFLCSIQTILVTTVKEKVTSVNLISFTFPGAYTNQSSICECVCGPPDI